MNIFLTMDHLLVSMADSESFTLIDHTADIGIEAHGRTVEEAFENVAKGMFAVITDHAVIQPKTQVTISLPRDADMEQLVIDWLSELLYLNDVKGLVFGKFQVKIQEMLEAKVWGEPYSRKKHGYGAEIKAVTYHLLRIKKDKKGVHIRVLLDV